MTGEPGLVRIGATVAGAAGAGEADTAGVGGSPADKSACPKQQAAKARPAMRSAVRSRARTPRLNEFPLGLVQDALDDVEFRGQSLKSALARFIAAAPSLGGSRPAHPGARRWARHAVEAYLNGAARIRTEAMSPVERYWVAQRTTGGTTWELYAWGRRYESAGGTCREFRFIRFGPVGAGRDPAEVALAAYTTAHGRLAPWPEPWREPFALADDAPADVQRVRVLEISLLDGDHQVLFDGTPADAEALYGTDARDRVRAVTVGAPARPGYSCVDCKLVTACGELPRIPGILGITDPAAPLRTWSATNGRYYSICPAQDHLIRLNLPRQNEYDPAAQRGQAVHAWLEQTHAGPLRSACTVWDVPVQPDDWSAGGWHVTDEQALLGARMLASHADLCPFHRADRITEVQLEPVFAVHDTAANVIVTAKPDLLYVEDGVVAWRETKTRQRLPRLGPNLFSDFPQIALATVLLARKALGSQADGKTVGARVELELLAPDSTDLLLIDAADPGEVARAQAAVHELAAPWHSDEDANPRPGPHCARCPVRRWCPDANGAAINSEATR
jgi:hypothetical protein